MADEFKPDAVSDDYSEQIAFWTMVGAILSGEAAVKAGKQRYLPKFVSETDAQYAARLEHSPFTNIFGDIVKNLASKPFSKPLEMGKGATDRHKLLAENIDGQGNNLHVFGSVVFKSALEKGIDWILVDYTRAKPRADGKPLTVADEREQGLRPYWVRIPCESMVAVYSVFIGGVETIFHARIKECSVEIDANLKETRIERIRFLKRELIRDEMLNVVGLGPAVWELWEQRSGTDGKTSWVLVDAGPITIGVIPLVPVVFGKRRGGSWVVEPPLRDLAHMQMTEYRQESNLEWVKIMTCFPMLCISGMSENDEAGKPRKIAVGPNAAFIIPPNQNGTGAAGEAKFVEPSAGSIKENREQLELTRKEMRDLGMQPLTQSALTVVTTANVSKKASSAVQAWAYLFQDALEQAWKLTGMWLGETIEPEIVIHTDFAVEMESGKELDAIIKAVAAGLISKETGFDELKRRMTIVTERTFEEEQELIAGEQQGMEGEEEIDPRTGRPIREPEPA